VPVRVAAARRSSRRGSAEGPGVGRVRSDTGTVSRRFSAERTAPNLGADRDDVALGPTHGVVAVPSDRPP
jgi:hypothetical protein